MTNKENQIRKSCNRFIENSPFAISRFDLICYIEGYDPKCNIVMATRIVQDLYKENKIKA